MMPQHALMTQPNSLEDSFNFTSTPTEINLLFSQMTEKSKILFIGGTGYIGKFIVEASAKSGHPTFALVRESTVSDPVKSKVVENFKNLGVTILHGDLYDHESLVKAIKQVDVVISTLGMMQLADQVKIIAAIKEAGNIKGDLYDHESLLKAIKQVDVVISTVGPMQLADQVNIIAAIKEAGNIKRFFPSEFGIDVDKGNTVEPLKSLVGAKAQIRRAIEAEGIPYTYVSSNLSDGYFLPTLVQLEGTAHPRDKIIIHGDGNVKEGTAPPRDKIIIPGDGNVKAVFNEEHDTCTYTIKAVDDPRTLNKILYIKPPKNTLSFNELVTMWEKMIGKTLEKIHIPEEQILKDVSTSSFPANFASALNHFTFVKGGLTNFKIEPAFGVEASELYPDVKYTTVEEYLVQFV